MTNSTSITELTEAERKRSSQPTVAVLLCSYMGSVFIEEQLDSLLEQSWPISIHIFDDRSSDNTVELAQKKLRDGIDTIEVNSENLGYVKNFEHGIKTLLENGVHYIALSDQDDIWHADRVEHGMRVLMNYEQRDSNQAVLVHSDLSVVNQYNQLKHVSYLDFRGYTKTVSDHLEVVLGQNGVMGNTVLMNASLASRALPFPDGLHVHDYWLSLVATLYGTRHYLDLATVRYRIHDANVSNSTVKLATGAQPGSKSSLVSRILHLNFRLPFMEDARLAVVETLLQQSDNQTISDETNNRISDAHRSQLQVFHSYLKQQGNRLESTVSMLRGGFLRQSLWHRIRFLLVQLITQRYR